MVVPSRFVWRPPIGTCGSSPGSPCGRIWSWMNGALLGLVAAVPCGEVRTRYFGPGNDVVKTGLNVSCVGKKRRRNLAFPRKVEFCDGLGRKTGLGIYGSFR